MRVAAVIIALKRKGKLSALLLWQLRRAARHKPAKRKSWCVEQEEERQITNRNCNGFSQLFHRCRDAFVCHLRFLRSLFQSYRRCLENDR